jgi:hypothetical protein
VVGVLATYFSIITLAITNALAIAKQTERDMIKSILTLKIAREMAVLAHMSPDTRQGALGQYSFKSEHSSKSDIRQSSPEFRRGVVYSHRKKRGSSVRIPKNAFDPD